MATVVIDDTFTGSQTNLDNHTPTDVGTGWTEIEKTGNRVARISGFGDVEPSGAENSDRVLYTAQGTYTSADYDIEIDIVADDTVDDLFWLLGRVTDFDNYYAAGIVDTPGTDALLVKKVTSTVTLIASANTDFNSGNWTGTTIKLEIRDAAKKLFAKTNGGYTELLSDGDNSLTSTGEGGLALGNIERSTDDIGASWLADNFLVTEVTAVAPSGTGVPTLEPFSVTAIGEQPYEGVGIPALEALFLVAAGIMQPSGIGTPTLETEKLAAVGIAGAPEGTGALTLEILDLATVGVEKFLATSVPTFEAMTLAAVGEQPFEGVGALALEFMTLVTVGEQPFEGVGALILEIKELAATGAMQPSGTSTLTLKIEELTAIGEQPFEGVGAPEIEIEELVAVGVMQPSGTGAPTLETEELAAVGVAGAPEGTGVPTLETLELAADGVMEADGTGVPTLADFLLAAVGVGPTVVGSLWPPMRRRRRPGR